MAERDQLNSQEWTIRFGCTERERRRADQAGALRALEPLPDER